MTITIEIRPLTKKKHLTQMELNNVKHRSLLFSLVQSFSEILSILLPICSKYSTKANILDIIQLKGYGEGE